MHQSKTSTLLVQTPEGIVFSLLLAGPVTRFLAWAVDVPGVAVLLILLVKVTGGYWINQLESSSGTLSFPVTHGWLRHRPGMVLARTNLRQASAAIARDGRTRA